MLAGMATTPDTTATPADHQQAVDTPLPRRSKLDQAHDRRTCAVHADCVKYRRRQASKAAYRAKGQYPKENAQYARDQLVRPWTNMVQRVVAGGNVEDLALLDASLDEVRAAVVRAVEEMRAADPEGASWSRIGGAIGLTPQGAQQKYGRRKRA